MKPKAIVISAALILLAAVIVLIFIVLTMKDEGILSVTRALERIATPGTLDMAEPKFQVMERVFSTQNLVFELRVLGAGPKFHADKLIVEKPLLPTALLNLAAEENWGPDSTQTLLGQDIRFDNLSFELSLEGTLFLVTIASLSLEGVFLKPSTNVTLPGDLGFLESLGAQKVKLENLTLTSLEGEIQDSFHITSAIFTDAAIDLDKAAIGAKGLQDAPMEAIFSALSFSKLTLKDVLVHKGALIVELVALTADYENTEGRKGANNELTGLKITLDPPEGQANTGLDLRLAAQSLNISGSLPLDLLKDLDGLFLAGARTPLNAISTQAIVAPGTFSKISFTDFTISMGEKSILTIDTLMASGPFLKGELPPLINAKIEGLNFLKIPGDPSASSDLSSNQEKVLALSQAPINLEFTSHFNPALNILIIQDLSLTWEGLFHLEGNLVALGLTPELLARDLSSPLIYLKGILQRPASSSYSIAGFSVSYRDLGLAEKLILALAQRQAAPPEQFVRHLAEASSLMLAAKLDPLIENTYALQAEIEDFIARPEQFFLSFHPEEAVTITSLYEALFSPSAQEPTFMRDRALSFLVGNSVSLSANGRDPVIVEWRAVPQAFDNDINPGSWPYDGLGDLD
ncbi:MAG: hypothetical protein LBE38_02985 [Deltaproteobacteria bacterium]|jgi:hypothetical protein|nr:hypothetical protein [Deltaproteobacteria bacterium]